MSIRFLSCPASLVYLHWIVRTWVFHGSGKERRCVAAKEGHETVYPMPNLSGRVTRLPLTHTWTLSYLPYNATRFFLPKDQSHGQWIKFARRWDGISRCDRPFLEGSSRYVSIIYRIFKDHHNASGEKMKSWNLTIFFSWMILLCRTRWVLWK